MTHDFFMFGRCTHLHPKLITLAVKARTICALLFFSLMPLASLAQGQEDLSAETQTTLISQTIEVSLDVEAEQAPLDNEEDNQDLDRDTEPSSVENRSSIERFVQPFTRWAEDQIHNTSLIRSPHKQLDTPAKMPGRISLRDAIKHALAS